MVEHLVRDGAHTTLLVGALIACTVAVAWAARRIRIPTPLAFLAIGVVYSSNSSLTVDPTDAPWVITLGSIALAIILFEGGFHGGWSQARGALGPTLAVGLVGTLLTAATMAALGHYLLGLSWTTASLIGIALAPTDPATVFSVLAGRTLRGRAGEVLEGESGVNDPVGIALMIGALELATHGGGAAGAADVALSFGTELTLGIIGGLLVGAVGNLVLTHAPLPSAAVHAIAAIAVALLAFGLTAEVHGSGFLAAYVAGMYVGEKDVRHHGTSEHTLSVVANLGETAMFLVLGLTITAHALAEDVAIGLAAFALLTFLVRPVVTLTLLAPTSLTHGERTFIAWGGLRGAVPILLAFLALVEGVPDAKLVYSVVFVAVASSVLVQGVTLPALGRRVGLIEDGSASAQARPDVASHST